MLALSLNLNKRIFDMARPRKEVSAEVGAKEAVETTKSLPIETFYAKYLGYTFTYPAVDEKGEQKFVMNLATGNPMYDAEGNKVPIVKRERFETVSHSFARGYLSKATFDPNDTTPQNVARGEALRGLALDRAVRVDTEENHIKSVNPDKWAEMQRAKSLESELESEREARKAAEISAKELEKRLAEISAQT
jgi:hypothetical protein